MAEETFMTELDILGSKQAVKERFVKRANIYVPFNYSPQRPISSLETLDQLLKRDEERKNDGFPKKIKFMIVMAGGGKVISVPVVEEEKLIHGEFDPKSDDELKDQDIGEEPGSGEGDVGDVIGEVPIHGGEGDGEDGEDPRGGQGTGDHGFEEEAYQKGKELSQKFQLPNLKDKGKKVPTDEYIYDLTDRHRGSGQVLDKKKTLESIIKTNIVLGLASKENLDTSKMVVGPNDRVYRLLSKEKVWKSMTIVFFARDYSGSMYGESTKAILAQHWMIYSWLLFQCEKLVIPRFFVHDTEAKEVSAIDYFKLMSGGGTFIPSVYKEITKTVEGEALARDYNIFIFQGTDGDDYDDGREAIPEIEKILGYVNRIGVSVLKHPYYGDRETPFEHYVKDGDFVSRKDVFRMHTMSSENVTEDDNIEAIKALIAQD